MRHRLYSILNKMKSRCYNLNHEAYDRYGGKGITICDEWFVDSKSFFNWAMSNGYEDGLTIDRIDNEKGYSPDNCRWVTRAEQNRNRSNNRMITLFGETKCAAEWIRDERIHISKSLFNKRIKNGMDDVEALTTPVIYTITINDSITLYNETKTVSAWCELLNISIDAVRGRVKRGMTVQEAFTKPVVHRRKK
jgi:hypothetical protein